MNLDRRSYQKELLDGDFIPFADIKQNMKELDFINSCLGGHGITIEAFKLLARNKKQISVCEIGCGGGDNLIAINTWCKKKSIELTVVGIDIKAACIEFAETRNRHFSHVKWIISDYRDVVFDTKPDIVFSSLFCHHFTEEQLVYQVQWMKKNSTSGFFINDLQRNKFAYYSIKLLTGIFSRSYLVKHDAPLSVARGFTRDELVKVCEQANIGNTAITWKWAFRYLVVLKHV